MTRTVIARGLGTSPAGPPGPPSTVPGPQGDDGPQGPRGLPGVNAVENDEAVATYIADPESQVASALSASIAAAIAANGGGADLTQAGYDLVLLLGQSNMQGDSSGTISTVLDITDPRIWSYGASGSYAGQIVQASDPLAHHGPGTTIVGPGMEFARFYAGTIPGQRRVLLVPAAANGTGFTNSSLTWDPTAANDSSNLYFAALAQIQAALVAAGPNSRLAAILWVQGETDAIGGLAAATYRTKLEYLIDGLRDRLSAPTLPFVIGSMLPEFVSTGGANATAINGVHVATPTRKPYTAFVQGPTGLSRGDNLHYSPAGQRAQGRRLLAGLAAARINVHPASEQPSNPPPLPAPTAPAQVTNLIANAGSGQVALTWTAPTNGGSAITDYVVQYRTAAGPGAWTTFADGTSTATTATVTGLTNATGYDFRVAATNAVGTGPYSATATATPAAAPTLPATDNFNGTDGNLTATPTGSPYTFYNGTWRRVSNQGAPAVSVSGATAAVIETGAANHYAQVVISAGGTAVGAGACVRATDQNNLYCAVQTSGGAASLYLFAAGNYAQLGATVSGGTIGDTIKISAVGSTITVSRNGTAIITATDTALTAGTKAGLWANTDSVRVDNFEAGLS